MERSAFATGRVLLSVMVASASLVACGGGGGGSKSSSETPAPVMVTAQGTVSGLDGSLVLTSGQSSLTLTADGAFTLATGVESGNTLTLSLTSAPEDQSCEITAAAETVNAPEVVTGVSIECVDLMSVSTTVQNYFTGEAIAGALVKVSTRLATGVGETVSAIADANGTVALKVPADAVQALVVSADASGFGEHSATVAVNGADPVSTTLSLQPANVETTFDATQQASLTLDSGAEIVSLPASSLVDASGNAVSGTVTSEVTLIDPSRDPELMPGGFVTTTDANSGLLESYGAMNVTFRDSEGELLNLGSGQTATVRIPVAEGSSSLPPTMPLYYFNTETGLWVEEGTATLVTVNGESYYEGQVAHFSTWNADQVYSTIQISGCVTDEDGNPVSSARVYSQGRDYVGSSSTTSDADGNFVLSVRRDSDVLLQAAANGLYDAASVNTGSSNITLDECMVLDRSGVSITLTWGQNPYDLDSHLGARSTDASEYFHIYYGNRSESVANELIELDVDDTDSFGPEVITLSDFPFPGEYEYGVKRYSGSGDIASSPARVSVRVGESTQVFSPPAGEPDDCWAVFKINVDENLNPTLVPVQTWEDRSYCSYLSNHGSNSMSAESGRQHPLTEAIENKYYAR